MNQTMKPIKILVIVSIYIALGLVVSPFLHMDLGFAKVFPVQSLLNVCIGVMFGISYNLMGSFALSTLRILLGVGTIMAYPGSLFGAYLSALAYKKSRSLWLAALGECIGTGIIGSLLAYLIAAYVLQTKVGAMAFVIPFMLSSLVGAILAQFLLRLLRGCKLDYIFSSKG